MEVSLDKRLNPTLHPGDLANESAVRVKTIYHPACQAIRSAAAMRDMAASGRQKGKVLFFAAEAAGTVTLFRGAECLCIDLADRENGEIFHMLYQGHRGINSLRPASSVLFSSRPRRHRL